MGDETRPGDSGGVRPVEVTYALRRMADHQRDCAAEYQRRTVRRGTRPTPGRAVECAGCRRLIWDYDDTCPVCRATVARMLDREAAILETPYQ